MGEREWGAKAPKNRNLEKLHDQKLREPTARSKRSWNRSKKNCRPKARGATNQE
jgi:hypothetical protein